jgi:hypothetical protein
MPNPDEKQYALRLSLPLYEKVVQLADADRRSINAEITVLLEEAIARRNSETLTDSQTTSPQQ